jgi:beta-lactamase class A
MASGLPQISPITHVCECSATTVSREFQVTSATTQFADGTLGKLEQLASAHRGRFGISVRNLDTGEVLEVNANAAFPTASTIKVPVMATALSMLGQPGSPLQDYYDSQTLDVASSATGAGFLQNYQPGRKVEVKELIHLMITVSDNWATNQLTAWIGGPAAVNQWLEKHGFRVLRMNATIGGRLVGDPGLRRDWGIGVTSPCEMRRLFEMIALGKAGSTSSTDEMLRILGNQYWDDLIQAEHPPMVWSGTKSGALNSSRSDAGIVASPGGRYAIAIFTAENADTRWTKENEAEIAIRAAAKIVWRHFNPDSDYTRPPGSELF